MRKSSVIPLALGRIVKGFEDVYLITAVRYWNMLQDMVIPDLQQRECFATKTFQQDGTPHVESEVQNSIWRHFTEDRIISRAFPTRWPPRSFDLTPCDFWLWGYLKDIVYKGSIRNLRDLKKQIFLHARNFSSVHLHASIDHYIPRFPCWFWSKVNKLKTTCKCFSLFCAFMLLLMSVVLIVSNISEGLIVCV